MKIPISHKSFFSPSKDAFINDMDAGFIHFSFGFSPSASVGLDFGECTLHTMYMNQNDKQTTPLQLTSAPFYFVMNAACGGPLNNPPSQPAQ